MAPRKNAASAAVAPAKTAETLPAVQTSTGTAVAVADDMSAFEGIPTGFENVTAADLLIPRLGILQGLSPQVTQGKPEYDKDARAGMIWDMGIAEGFPDGVTIVPLHYSKVWLEWAPRESGKGLIEVHYNESILDQTEEDGNGRAVLPNGNYIAETAQLYGLHVERGFQKVFIPMTSTQLKKARLLLTLATSEKIARPDGSEFTPPLFYRSYSFTTVPESNNKGSWMGWKIERGDTLVELAPKTFKSIIADILEFKKSIEKGEARGDLSTLAGETGGTAPAGGEDERM